MRSGGGSGGGGDGVFQFHQKHHIHPHILLENGWKIQSRRMLILAHLQSPVFYELTIIGNHHQMVDGDDGHHGHSHHDGHGDYSPGDSHRDHSLPWGQITVSGFALFVPSLALFKYPLCPLLLCPLSALC